MIVESINILQDRVGIFFSEILKKEQCLNLPLPLEELTNAPPLGRGFLTNSKPPGPGCSNKDG